MAKSQAVCGSRGKGVLTVRQPLPIPPEEEGSTLGCTRVQRDWSAESLAELRQRSDCETTTPTLYLGCSKIHLLGILTSFLEIRGQEGGKLAEVLAPGFLFKNNPAAISLRGSMFYQTARGREYLPRSEVANLGTCAIWCDPLAAVGIQGHMRLPLPLERCNYWGHKGVSKEKKINSLYLQIISTST